MIGRLLVLAGGSLALAILLPTSVAHADAIDGHWCYIEDGRMEISGPAIVTASGTRMQGIYDRHAISYIVPAAEPAAGATVDMILIDDDTVHLTKGASASSPQVWNRCPAPIS